MKKLFILFFAASTTLACGTSSNDTTTVTAMSVIDSVKNLIGKVECRNKYYYNTLNQTARIIAGMNDPMDTIFSVIRNSPSWKTYAAESDEAWKSYYKKNSALVNWTKNEVHPVTVGVKSLFYPFSGPDFLYANMLFPDIEIVYMLGLEKLGSVPDFKKITSVDGYINAYKTAINEILQDSYYRTIKMMSNLNNQNVDGVIPVIMLYMARANKQISEINYITLDASGAIIPTTKAEVNKQRNRGVEVRYFAGTDGVERRLVFFSGDVQEKVLAENTANKNFLQSIKTEAAFSKAASYLMHHPIFATVRNTILANCNTVISDDTGIAFRFYDPKVWNAQLYGSYNGCIDDFKYIFEKDLDAAYKDPSRKIIPLDFRIGYSRPSNARIMTRK